MSNLICAIIITCIICFTVLSVCFICACSENETWIFNKDNSRIKYFEERLRNLEKEFYHED